MNLGCDYPPGRQITLPCARPTSTIPGDSIGPSEAISGILEHLLGTAPGFRNLTHYIADAYSKPEASDH